MSYDETRDRELAPLVPYAMFSREAVRRLPAADELRKLARCERLASKQSNTRPCSHRSRFWVQRGPISLQVCASHLPTTVQEMHEIKPGRYGVSEHYEGYWISTHQSVVVKMRVGEGWR